MNAWYSAMVEVILAEYSDKLEDVLEWSTGRIFVIWRRRRERFERQKEAMDKELDRARNSGASGRNNGDRGPAPGQTKTVAIESLEDLGKSMGIKTRPYPGKVNVRMPEWVGKSQTR